MSSAAATTSAGGASGWRDPDRSGAAVDRDRLLCGRCREVEVGEVGTEGVVELAGDVALEAADDLGFAQALGGAAVGVGAGASTVAEPADGDQVERSVGLAVAAAAEPVSARASGGGGDWTGSAETGEGAVVRKPLDVLAGGGEQLAGVLGRDAEQARRSRRGRRDQRGELLVEQPDLPVEVAHASGDAAQRELCRLQRLVQSRPIGP